MMSKKRREPVSYREGKLQPYNFKNLPKEVVSEYARRSAESRRKKRKEKMFLQKCMKELLGMNITSEKQKEILRKMGIDDSDMQNQTLLMVALFLKGTKGDVAAIKEIVDMMDRLDILEDTGKISQGININLIPVGEENKNKESEVWDEEDEGWGDDVF